MVVGYCRISVDEGDSSSVEEQEHLILDYAKEHNIYVDKVFKDEGYSGYVTCKFDDTLFERPAFLDLWSLIKQGIVKQVIVKDMSRIGRKMSCVNLFLERLQTIGCSCIDITGQEILTETSGLFSWIHESYVKDISKKVRLSMNSRQKDGRMFLNWSCYGYIKDSQTNLRIDTYTSEAVKLIFRLYLNGYGYVKIAKYLNENTDFPTPGEYFANNKASRGEKTIRKTASDWSMSQVSRILSNELYIGTMIAGQYKIEGIKGKAKKQHEEKTHKFCDHHEAIISKEDFQTAQELRQKKSQIMYRNRGNIYLFSGFCICADCGHSMSGYNKYNIKRYNCPKYVNYGKKGCSYKRIDESDLLERFKQILVDVRDKYIDFLMSEDIKKKQDAKVSEVSNAKRDLSIFEKEYRTLQVRKNRELNSKDESLHSIIYDQYDLLEQDALQQIKNAKARIAFLEKQTLDVSEKHIKKLVDTMDEIISSDTPEKRLLEALLDKIIVYQDKFVQFELKIKTDLWKQ